MKTGLITSDTYQNHNTGEGHPEKIDRVTAVIENFKKLDNKNLVWKKPSSFEQSILIKTHTKDYIKQVNLSFPQSGLKFLDGDTNPNKLGEMIKIGRRGSITGKLIVIGVQGHVAYPDQAINPIHEITPLLSEFIEEKWDHGNQHFPPTSLQIVNINAGANAANVIPGEVNLQFNLRFSPELSARKVKSLIIKKLNKHNLNFSILWDHNADPFYSEPGLLA